MYVLIVMIFAMIDGVMGEQPLGQFYNKTTFTTERSCMEFLESEPGYESRLLIEEMVEEKRGKIGFKTLCIQNFAFKEDDSI